MVRSDLVASSPSDLIWSLSVIAGSVQPPAVASSSEAIPRAAVSLGVWIQAEHSTHLWLRSFLVNDGGGKLADENSGARRVRVRTWSCGGQPRKSLVIGGRPLCPRKRPAFNVRHIRSRRQQPVWRVAMFHFVDANYDHVINNMSVSIKVVFVLQRPKLLPESLGGDLQTSSTSPWPPGHGRRWTLSFRAKG